MRFLNEVMSFSFLKKLHPQQEIWCWSDRKQQFITTDAATLRDYFERTTRGQIPDRCCPVMAVMRKPVPRW